MRLSSPIFSTKLASRPRNQRILANPVHPQRSFVGRVVRELGRHRLAAAAVDIIGASSMQASNDDGRDARKRKAGPDMEATAATAAAAAEPTPASEVVPEVKGQGKRKKKGSEEDMKTREFIHSLHMAAKHNDMGTAMALWEGARENKIELPANLYNTLLYVACGGESWEMLARRDQSFVPKLDLKDPLAPTAGVNRLKAMSAEEFEARRLGCIDAAAKVWAAMQEAGIPLDEARCMSLARVEALKGEPSKALEWAHTCIATKQSAALRVFHPALVGYALAGDVAAAKRVDVLIKSLEQATMDLTEYEYALLLETYFKAGAWEDITSVFIRMQEDLNQLQATTLSLIESFFKGSRARKLLKHSAKEQGKPYTTWDVQSGCTVDATGLCKAAEASLKMIDLKDHEWESFATGIAALARRIEAGKSNFDGFIEWYNRNGPYDVMIDAANVAYFGQKGNFRWNQIMAMTRHIEKQYPPPLKVLVVLHVKRLKDAEARNPAVQAFVEETKAKKSFYYAPHGSNDDWYWLYASARAKGKGTLISNDELRDHIFGLLRPKHFLKWKERHIVHYRFAPNGAPLLEYPSATAVRSPLYL
eukprot:gene20025-26740_t